MIDVSDLIGCPYVENGRDSQKGLDCYGLIMEVSKRLGKPLRDVLVDTSAIQSGLSADEVKNYIPALNIKTTNELKEGTLLEFYSKRDRKFHSAIALDKKTIIHATENQGVRISTMQTAQAYLKLVNMYEVI